MPPKPKEIAAKVAQRHSNEANAFIGAHLGEPLTEPLAAQIGMIWLAAYVETRTISKVLDVMGTESPG